MRLSKKSLLAPLILLGLFHAAPAFGCACCNNPGTFRTSKNPAEYELQGAGLFRGELLRQEEWDSPFPLCEGKLRGVVEGKELRFKVYQGTQLAGTFTVKPVGKTEKTQVGMDLMYSKRAYSDYKMAEHEPPVYHRWVMNVQLEPDAALRKSCGPELQRDGRLSFHGTSNNCWEITGDYHAGWVLDYSVKNGDRTVEAAATGVIEKIVVTNAKD